MHFNDSRSPAWDALVEAAWKSWEHAHAPYSAFRVGAALLWNGGIVSGCNVENAAYPSSLCAERTAICSAVALGMTPGNLDALVVASEAPTLAPPCGACRQVLAEFADDLPILLVNRRQRALHSLAELLPHAFTSRNLNP